MTRPADPPRRGYRWAALALFFALPLGLAVAGSLTTLDALKTYDDTNQKERQLAQFRQRLGDAASRKAPPLDFSRLYLKAASPSLAGAQLQERLSRLVSTNSGKVIETGIVDADTVPASGETSDAETIKAQATFDIDNDGLLRVLHDLEADLPIIDITALAVRPVGSAPSSEDVPLVLRVDLTVTGYLKEPVS